MSKRTSDKLWKAILETRFRDAIQFFKPELHEQIDWSIEPEFLDKELDSLFPESELADRQADKLVKVQLNSSEERWILIHIEVQGYSDPHFLERMYIYNVRVRERYGRCIYALAVLTDSDPDWRPSEYRAYFMGTEIIYRFDLYKVLDHPPESLLLTDNPFSIVIETAWFVAKTYRLSDETKYRAGIDLARRFFTRGYEKREIRDILRFIWLHFRFSDSEMKRNFDAEIIQFIQTSPDMTADQIFEELIFERGMETGLEQGLEQGLEKAICKMLLSGMAAYMVANILNAPIEKIEKIEAAMRQSGELTD